MEVDPNENGAKMKLAQIYEIMNEKQLALDLVNQGKPLTSLQPRLRLTPTQ